MERYDNGEPITKGRMEDERWYPDYQSLMELSVSTEPYTISELMDSFEKAYFNTFNKKYPNKARLLRWCVLQTARHKDSLLIPKEEVLSLNEKTRARVDKLDIDDIEPIIIEKRAIVESIRSCAIKGLKIQAIIRIRAQTGLGLKEAKDLFEANEAVWKL
jgi:hypothetical protein